MRLYTAVRFSAIKASTQVLTAVQDPGRAQLRSSYTNGSKTSSKREEAWVKGPHYRYAGRWAVHPSHCQQPRNFSRNSHQVDTKVSMNDVFVTFHISVSTDR